MCEFPYSAIFFDLDGTLTDPAVGITRCIAYALERLQATVPDPVELRAWIGPTLRESFATYLNDPASGEQALALYRERFARVGLFENVCYPGIPELLAELQAQGCRMFLATGKPQPYAHRILAHFDLLRYFTVVGGATLDGRISSKAAILATLLPHLTTSERTACIMVGDREQDILGARTHNMPCIAVSYGYGSLAELCACAPAYIVGSVADLHTMLCNA